MRQDTYEQYYEEVRIIPRDSICESGTLIGVGPGPGRLPRINLPRTWVNKGEGEGTGSPGIHPPERIPFRPYLGSEGENWPEVCRILREGAARLCYSPYLLCTLSLEGGS